MSVALVLIAIGSAALVAARPARFVVAALMVQWLGVAWAVGELLPTPSVFGLGGAAAAELVTALVCGAVLGLTVRSVRGLRGRARAQTPVAPGIYDYLWTGAVVLAGGITGLGLAALYPLGVGQQYMIGFYWVVLSSVLALVLDGSRNIAKLSAGLLALLNGLALLLYALSLTPPDPVSVGLLALSRIGVTVVATYAWVVLKSAYPGGTLSTLFDRRDGRVDTDTALVVAGPTSYLVEPQAPANVASDE